MNPHDLMAIVTAPKRWRMLKFVKAELEQRIAETESQGADASYLKIRLKDVDRRMANGETIDSPF